ncbi:hypothetical protein ACF065_22890 [Streptomyces sp. NPDC015232]|uniref:hypothetical protein n=1 Tax=unclassified Streptomyces TaxID=2593676 RepID=UPI0036F73C6C
MGITVLVVWVVTALLGAFLLTIWLRNGGLRQRDARVTRLPVWLILGHIGLAVLGLASWSLFLLGRTAAFGWAAGAVVLIVATFGLMMLFRWLPSSGRHAHGEPTAEGHFPATAVIAHGVCAVVTVLLVVAAVSRTV